MGPELYTSKKGLSLQDDTSVEIRKKFYNSIIMFSFVVLFGTIGYKFVGGEEWSFIDSLYMTVITLTTVGYGETHPVSNVDLRVFTILLILLGFGVVTYTFGTITAYMVEGNLKHSLKRRKMLNEIKKMSDHIIVCGAGRTGMHIIAELFKADIPFVVIDKNRHLVEKIIHSLGDFPYISGDATDDEVLYAAGIERSKGVMSALTEDKDNLFIIISVRSINPEIRIVSKVVDLNSASKLKRAGADIVTSPEFIGGRRMTSEMIKPSVTGFLDHMRYNPEAEVSIEELTISDGSLIAGKTLFEADIKRSTGARLLAIRTGKNYNYTPENDTVLKKGDVLILFVTSEQIQSTRELIG